MIPATAQSALPLSDAPDDYLTLRAAFQRLDLERACRMTFEQFIRDDLRRRCLGNVVHARLRALNQQQPTKEVS